MKMIPFDHEVASKFEEKLSRTAFRSTDQFIMLYNQNIINKNNDKNNEIAQEITEVYKNITLKNRLFIIQSEDEMTVANFAFILPNMALIAQLKRIAGDIIKENYPETTALIFKESDDGTIYVVDTESDEEPHVYIGAEKVSKLTNLISSNPFLIDLIFDYNVEDEVAGAIKVTDILSINTEFITKIGVLLNDFL